MEKFPKTSAKMIYDFCHISRDPFLNKVRHKDIRSQKHMDIHKCYSALYIHEARWHPLLTKLKKETRSRLSQQLEIF